jgi:hypothetical protein
MTHTGLPPRANPWLNDIVSYIPGKPIEDVARELGLKPEQIIKLASNENPLGPSPKAVAAMQEALLNAHYYQTAEATIYARLSQRNFSSRWIMSSSEMDRTKSSNSWDTLFCGRATTLSSRIMRSLFTSSWRSFSEQRRSKFQIRN